MDERTESRPLSGPEAFRAGDIIVLVIASALVGLAVGFFAQSAVIGVVAGILIALIAGLWTWRARRSGAGDDETRATTRQAADERRSHPEYGPLRSPGTFGVRVGTGAAGKDNGRG
jgi:hypothetical protein